MNIQTQEYTITDLVSALGFIAIIRGTPQLHELWTEAYPHDPMNEYEASVILFDTVDHLQELDLHSPDDVDLVLSELGRQLPDLVQVFTHHLEQSHQ